GGRGGGPLREMHLADCTALAARLGWMPAYPSFDRNPLTLADEAAAEGLEPSAYVVRELGSGRLGFAAEDPDGPGNSPRVLTLWRADPPRPSPQGAREISPPPFWGGGSGQRHTRAASPLRRPC